MITSMLRSLRGQDSSRLAPELQGGLPLVGHVHEFSRRPVDMLRRGRERHGEAFRFRLVNKDVTVLSGPKAHKAFFHAPEDVLSAKECYKFTVPVFGRGVAYDVEPDDDGPTARLDPSGVKRQATAVARSANVMLDEVETYLDRWGDAGQIDLFKVTQELTTYIATRCLLGDEVRRNLTEDFARLYHDLDGGMRRACVLLAIRSDSGVSVGAIKPAAEVVRLLSGVMAKRRRVATRNARRLSADPDGRPVCGWLCPARRRHRGRAAHTHFRRPAHERRSWCLDGPIAAQASEVLAARADRIRARVRLGCSRLRGRAEAVCDARTRESKKPSGCIRR